MNKWPQVRVALGPRQSPEQIDQELHSSHAAFSNSVGRQGIKEPCGVLEEREVLQEPGTQPGEVPGDTQMWGLKAQRPCRASVCP